MREHSQALRQLFLDILTVKRGEHGLLDASFAHVVDADVFKPGKLLEEAFCSNSLVFDELLGEHFPVGHALPEYEAGEVDLLELDAAGELLESRCDDRLVLDGVERAGRVGEAPAHLQQLQAFKQDARLQHVQRGPVLRRPLLPLLRDLPDGCV